jgi:hypothetical protein
MATEALKSADQTSTESPYLDQTEAAAFVRLSPRTLEGLRVSGKGPAYRKLGKKKGIVYKVADLIEWGESHRCTSTSDNR